MSSLVPSPSLYAVHVYVDNCGGEHFETGSETSREVDLVLYIIIVQVYR